MGASESGARMAVRMDNIEKEAEDAADNDELEPAMSSNFYQPEAGEAEYTFATMRPDDAALDMDTEIGYITEEESNDGSEVLEFRKNFLSLL